MSGNQKRALLLLHELHIMHPFHFTPAHISKAIYYARHFDQDPCVDCRSMKALIRLGLVVEDHRTCMLTDAGQAEAEKLLPEKDKYLGIRPLVVKGRPNIGR